MFNKLKKQTMKKTIIFSAVAIAFTIIACNNSSNKSETSAKADSTAIVANSFDTTKLAAGTTFYQCPMDPEEISDKPGSCPKCGMDLEKVVKQ